MGPDLHLQHGAPSLRGGEVFFNASFISADGLNAPLSGGRFGASLYVTEEITEIIRWVHWGIIWSSSCSY